MRLRFAAVLYFLTALTVAPTAMAAVIDSPAKLTVEDLADAAGMTSVALSPDGRQFAIVANEQIELVSSGGGWPQVLTTTAGGKTGLKWSPDGRSVAFVSQGAIWSVGIKGGQPVRLTEGRHGAGDPRTAADRDPQWSPDSKWILFATGQRGNADLALVSADGLTITFLTDSPADEENAAWSPDGTRIAYIERASDYFSGRVVVADLDKTTGHFRSEPRVLYTAPVDRGGGWSIRRPEWSPDGKSLALVLQNTGWDKIYLEPVTGGDPRAITVGEGDDDDPVFSPSGDLLAFTSNREKPEERHVWVVSPSGTAPRLLADISAGVDSDPIWSPDGHDIYYLHSSSFEPGELAVTPVHEGKAQNLIRTQPINFANTGLEPPEVVHYNSDDGLTIAAILYRPLHYASGQQYPAVLWIHGGPEGQDVFRPDGWAQYLAQAGYVVLEPNYRGSTGYGEAFRNLNVEDSNGGEVDDVATGAQYLIARGLADSARLAIGGGSHGGTMTAYMVVHYPDLFAAAIELYGVVDRKLFVERTNPPSSVRWMMKMGGTPTEKPEVYQRANVLLQVDKVKTPLLVMHGENDPQVPPADSAFFVKALREHHKTVFYFTYPNELHGFSQPAHRLDAWQKY